MANPASIRLGTTGKAQVKADLVEIADTGDAQAKRWAKSYENAGRDVEAAMQRQKNAAAKISAIMPQTAVQMRIGDVNSTGFGQWEGSARSSAAAFAALYAEEERLEKRTRALVAAIDPAYAAQDRFNREIAEARTLVSAGTLSLDQYVVKLRLEQEALDAASGAHMRGGNSAGAQRAAMQGLSYQLQDTFTQISMGTNVLQVFAIQGGQVAGQFSGLEGKAGNFARFMIGPWGLAITAGALVLGPFLGKLIDVNNAVDEGVDKLKKDATETENARIAKDRFARSAAGVAASIREQAEALDTAAKGERSAAERANILAKENLSREMSIRGVTAAMLDQAIAQENLDRTRSQGPGQRGELGTLALTESSGRVSGLQAQLKANQAAIDEAKRNLMGTRIDLATESAARAGDPLARIKKQYDDQAMAARTAAREAIKNGQDVTVALTRQLAGIERNREAAVKAEQDKQREMKKTAKVDGETLRANDVARMLRTALPGVQVTSTTGGQHVKNSYHYRNQAVDFVPKGGMDSMTKADVRKIFESRGIDVVELLGPGDKGHSDHFHVAWTKGKLALDGFNDAAKRTKEAQRDAAKASRELDGDLADVVKQFDPARAAGDEYAATLAKIATLRGAGKLSADQAGDYTYLALKDRQAKDAAQQAASFKTMFGDIEDPFAAGNANWRDQQDEQINAWTVEHERRQQVQQEGVRTVAGLYRNLMSGGTRSIFDAFKQRGMDAIADLAAKWTMSQIGKLGEKGGLIGSLANLISGTPGGGAPKIGANAAGTEYWGGGISLVGENGPELVSMARGSRVTPAADTRRMLAGNDNIPAISMPISIDATGADAAGLARVEQQLADLRSELPGRVVAAYNDAKTRRVIR